jgi:hypothetical protein
VIDQALVALAVAAGVVGLAVVLWVLFDARR